MAEKELHIESESLCAVKKIKLSSLVGNISQWRDKLEGSTMKKNH